MKKRIVIPLVSIVAAAALWSTVARSQQPAPAATQTAPAGPKTHAEYEPPTGPGAGQALLSQFAGDWDVVKTFYRPTGDPVSTKGECIQRMIQDGRFLQSDFTFVDAKGVKSTGTGISGFEPKTNKFTTVWFDSHKTDFSIRQSDGTFDGKQIVLWATSLDPDKPGRKSVARAHLEDNGNVLVHTHYMIDEKGTERKMIEFRMTKRKGH